MKVGVLGTGNWGTTVAHLLAQGDSEVLLWGRSQIQVDEINKNRTNKKYTKDLKISSGVKATTSLQEVATQCKIIFIVIPSQVFRFVAHDVGQWAGGDQILVSGTKGIENTTYRFMTDILREETCCRKIGVLSGPNIADEINRNHPGGAVIASYYNEVIDSVMELFKLPLFKVYAHKDVRGVEIGGALKNIVAIASGITTGLGYETNSKAFLVTRGLAEISRFGKFFGANPQTFLGLSGMGDIVTTCFSMSSRNNTFGRLLSQGKTVEHIQEEIGMVVEGVATTKAVYEISKKFMIRMPITEGLYKILFENAPLAHVLKNLMEVRMKFEDEGYKQELSEIQHMLVDKYPNPEYLF